MANNTGFAEVKSISNSIENTYGRQATSKIGGVKSMPGKGKSATKGKESGFHIPKGRGGKNR